MLSAVPQFALRLSGRRFFAAYRTLEGAGEVVLGPRNPLEPKLSESSVGFTQLLGVYLWIILDNPLDIRELR